MKNRVRIRIIIIKNNNNKNNDGDNDEFSTQNIDLIVFLMILINSKISE